MKAICLGDSLTFGYGVEKYESWVSILNVRQIGEFINRGIPGDTTEQMKKRYSNDVLVEKPSHVFLMGGTNDILLNMNIHIALNNMVEMVERSIRHNIVPVVLIPLTVCDEVKEKEWFLDMNYKTANKMLLDFRNLLIEYVAKNNIYYFDLMRVFIKEETRSKYYLKDGIHVIPEIHKRIADLISKEFA